MQTIKYTKMDINKIINVLISGGIVAFPTDTVFGLACTINKEAIDKVYKAKGRSFDKPLPMMCDGIEMIESVAYVNEDTKKIIDKFTPGALTIIFKKKESVEDYVTNGKDTIGIRIPDDEWILDLIKKMNAPLLVTSANLSDTGSLIRWEDVYKQLDGKVDGIVCQDARGESSSTIIDATSKEIKMLRSGPIQLEEIMEVLK